MGASGVATYFNYIFVFTIYVNIRYTKIYIQYLVYTVSRMSQGIDDGL